ncbi:hypothetical protein BDW02DRAFT_616475 [Decorospora gaudefroyi]|uniref:BTB domain-containing protein n=1 Tax=Decorospora gaudefroyi TaxID=184978 RepID=A0A6A5KKU9_9PLEO|nr:hypothetical protein BDW02DRAFT_616475 [Decorospora gaudefroyi]
MPCQQLQEGRPFCSFTPWNVSERRPFPTGTTVKLSFNISGRCEQIEVPRELLYTSDYLYPWLATWDRLGTQCIILNFSRRSIFAIYCRWLYGRKVYTNSEIKWINGLSEKRGAGEIINSDFYDLLACWFLGNALQDVRFKDMVVSDIVRRLNGCKNGETRWFFDCLQPVVVHDFYRNTKADSPIRALLVDAVVKFATPTFVSQLGTSFSAEFVLSVMGAFAQEVDRLRSQPVVTLSEPVKKVVALMLDPKVAGISSKAVPSGPDLGQAQTGPPSGGLLADSSFECCSGNVERNTWETSTRWSRFACSTRPTPPPPERENLPASPRRDQIGISSSPSAEFRLRRNQRDPEVDRTRLSRTCVLLLGNLLEEKRFEEAVISKIICWFRALAKNPLHIEVFVKGMGGSFIKNFVEDFTVESALFKLVVAAVAWFAGAHGIRAFCGDECPIAFRQELGVRLLAQRDTVPANFALNECEFHHCRVDKYECTVKGY